MRRLFLGLSVEPEVGRRLVRVVASALDGTGEYTLYGVDDLHLTLLFLGEVEDERVERLVRCAALEFRGLHAPELGLGARGDAFPDRQNARSLHARVSESAEAAGRLDVLRNRALQVGLSHGWRPGAVERARPFLPHVTVARVARVAREGARTGEGAPSIPDDFWELGAERSWTPVDVTLFESLAVGDSNGERYRVVASWPLVVEPR